MTYDFPKIQRLVVDCLDIFSKNDSFLIQNDLNERCVSHKLGEYLQTKFQDWNVDCEYNRKGLDIKTLDKIRDCSDQRTTDRVLPDIIIHKRNSNDNLLVVEIKIEKEDSCDIEKLKLFTSTEGEFKYQFGLFVKFQLNNETSIRWFKDGTDFSLICPKCKRFPKIIIRGNQIVHFCESCKTILEQPS